MLPLTFDEIKRFDLVLGQLTKIEPEIDGLLSASWVGRYLRRIGYEFSWHQFYEFSFVELMCFLILLTGNSRTFLPLMKESGSFGAILDFVEEYEPDFSAGKPKKRQIVLVLLSLKAILRSTRCIECHSVSLDELVKKGLSGSPLALRRAISVDPTLLAMPSIASRLAALHVFGEKRELKAVYHAAQKGPNKQLDPYRRLRYLERVIRESQMISVHGKESVFRFLTEDLRLYDARGGDPFKSLFLLFDRWRLEATT